MVGWWEESGARGLVASGGGVGRGTGRRASGERNQGTAVAGFGVGAFR